MNGENTHDANQKLSSRGLAVLIVDALIDAKLVPKDRFNEAVSIAVEEIDVRKAAGDY